MEENIPPVQIRHKGLYDFEGIYRAIRAWFRQREYDYNEGRYKDKTSDFGNEVELKMNGEIKITDFVQYNVDIEAKFFGVKEFETDFKGEKRKVNNGQFFIVLTGKVTYDYKKRFKSEISKAFLKFLIGTLLKNYYDVKYVDRLYYDVYDLHTLIKTKAFMETATNAY